MDEYSNYINIHDGIVDYFDETMFNEWAKTYHKMHGRFLPTSKDKKILDVGCGNGFFLYYLKNLIGANSYGIDLCQESIDFVKKHITDKCECVDAFDFLENNKNSYDAIVLNEILEHLSKKDIPSLLKSVYLSLKKNGVILIVVPNMENPMTVYTRWHDFTHSMGFTKNSLKMVLRQAGFEDVRVFPTTMFGRYSLVRRIIMAIPRFLTKKYLQAVFQYPKHGILFSKRIFAVAKK